MVFVLCSRYKDALCLSTAKFVHNEVPMTSATDTKASPARTVNKQKSVSLPCQPHAGRQQKNYSNTIRTERNEALTSAATNERRQLSELKHKVLLQLHFVEETKILTPVKQLKQRMKQTLVFLKQ